VYSYESQSHHYETYCFLMKGLPFKTTETQITNFFQEAGVMPCRIHRKEDGTEAYVEFRTEREKTLALTRHKKWMGKRYVELFPCSLEDIERRIGGSLPPIQPQILQYFDASQHVIPQLPLVSMSPSSRYQWSNFHGYQYNFDALKRVG